MGRVAPSDQITMHGHLMTKITTIADPLEPLPFQPDLSKSNSEQLHMLTIQYVIRNLPCPICNSRMGPLGQCDWGLDMGVAAPHEARMERCPRSHIYHRSHPDHTNGCIIGTG